MRVLLGGLSHCFRYRYMLTPLNILFYNTVLLLGTSFLHENKDLDVFVPVQVDKIMHAYV